jgi:hemolysin activation/secretion protein
MAMKWSIGMMVVAMVLLGVTAAADAQRDPADRSLRLDEDAIRTDIRRDRLEKTETPPLAPQPSQVVPKAKGQTKPKRTGSGTQP